MSETEMVDGYGRLIEPDTLEMQRLLPGPIERVWSYLVDEDKRRLWFAAGVMDLHPGAEFSLTWKNDELTRPAGERPAGMSCEHTKTCRIVDVSAPHRLVFQFGVHGEVTFTLAPAGARVLLTLVHRRIPDRATRVGVGGGWHVHLDLLAARLEGRAPAPFWDEFRRLREHYEAHVPA